MNRYINVKDIRLTALSQTDSNGDVLVSLQDVRNALAQTPTADVVEVVRCKNCIHFDKSGACNHFGYYTYVPDVDEDDYCSYGERSANDE